MTTVEVGPLRLLVPSHGFDRSVVAADGVQHAAWVTPAVVSGPNETLVEIALSHWVGGGDVGSHSRGESHPYFQRLVQGCRLTLSESAEGDGTAIVRAAVWDHGREWCNLKMVTLDDLDRLLDDSARELLIGFGVTALGTRAELWGDTSTKKNHLEARFDPDDVLPPLVIYTLTRTLPVFRAVEEMS